ncbi:MAG: phospholipid-binding protein MlaC [Kiloniellaceae bacterium]
MLSRRQLFHRIASSLLGAAVFSATPIAARAADPQPAGGFLASMTSRAIEQLTDTSLELDERQRRFQILFRENFDIPAIGRFVIGRYWRGTSEKARTDFLEVFEEVMVRRFAPQFAGYAGTRFRVGMIREIKENAQFIVATTIKPPQGDSVRIDWRVQRRDGHFQILDVIGQGVSMALTLRSEYTAVIKNTGGRVEGLTLLLRERLRQQGDITATTSAAK